MYDIGSRDREVGLRERTIRGAPHGP